MDIKKIIIIIVAIIVIGVVGIFTFNSFSYNDDGVVTIGYMPTDHHSALLIADAQGQFEKNGVKVKLIQFNNGGDMMVALASGDLDIAYVGITPALTTISKGVPAKIVSSVQNEGSGIVVDPSSNINSVNDLKGKTISTPGESSIQYLLLVYALEKAGLKKEDVSISSMKVASMMDALRTNNIDGMLSYEPYVTMATEEGVGKLIASSSDILPGHPCCVIVANENFINNNKADLDKILAIHENTTKFINENPDEAAKLLPSNIVADPEIEKKAMAGITFTYGLDDSYIKNVMEFMQITIDLGFLEKPLTESQIFFRDA